MILLVIKELFLFFFFFFFTVNNMVAVEVQQDMQEVQAEVAPAPVQKQKKGKGPAIAKKKRTQAKFKSPFVRIFGDAQIHTDALREVISIIRTPAENKGDYERITLGLRPPHTDKRIFVPRPVKGEKGVDIEAVIKKIKTSVRAAQESDNVGEGDHMMDLIEAETAGPSSSSVSARKEKRPRGLAESDEEEEEDAENSQSEEEEAVQEKKKKKKNYDSDASNEY